MYGGSHSPTRRPPVLMFRAARRDLAALAPLATGPHGWKEPGAVLARCLRGLHRYAGGSGLRRACADSLAAVGSDTMQARRYASRQPVRPARQPPHWPDSSSQARARQASGPPQPWPSGQPDGSGLPPAPRGSGPAGQTAAARREQDRPAGPLPYGGHHIRAVQQPWAAVKDYRLCPAGPPLTAAQSRRL